MIERGRVVSVAQGRADVQLSPSAHCEACGCCNALEDGAMVLPGVKDDRGAAVGDLVEIEVPDRSRLVASLFGYGVPIVALVLGYLAGSLLGSVLSVPPDAAGAVGGVAAILAVLAAVRARGRRLFAAEKYQPRLRAIITRGHEGADSPRDGGSTP